MTEMSQQKDDQSVSEKKLVAAYLHLHQLEQNTKFNNESVNFS